MKAKEIPILYSPMMVLAKVQGRKDVTRRLVAQPEHGFIHIIDGKPFGMVGEWEAMNYPERYKVPIKCPWLVGATLWGRERFQLGFDPPAWNDHYGDDGGELFFTYCADGQTVEVPNYDTWLHRYELYGPKVYPSLHMPKFACRIWDEIVDVRMERLHDITEEDAIREGIERAGDGWRDYLHLPRYGYPMIPWKSPKMSYQTLWESINGKGSWAENPWVWRIETEAIERPSFAQCG